MVSGGADSMAMLRLLIALKGRLGFELEVLHVHHGPSSRDILEADQTAWRDRAASLVLTFCEFHGVSFHISKSKSLLRSEADFRRFRWQAIEALVAERSRCSPARAIFDCVAFAHHREDLLETRLIRLLRGTGKQGLRGMSLWSQFRGILVWRPFISSSRQEIRDYLDEAGARVGEDWIEDQTNADVRYLRNAIRHRLLPLIESLRPNGVETLARSLETLAEEAGPFLPSSQIAAELWRADLMKLSPELRRAKLSHWLLLQGVQNYSKAHVLEVLKRLDTDQRRLTFTVCGRVWLVDEKVRIVALSQQVQELE
jgi:tRNA(Ile)-lysidine synthase